MALQSVSAKSHTSSREELLSAASRLREEVAKRIVGQENVIEEILIRRALQKTKGNRTRAAEVLEISHRALLYKIKDYEISDL